MVSGFFGGQLNPDDLGLWRGWGVFEAMAARGNSIFHFKEHCDRLISSCERSGIYMPKHFSSETLRLQLSISFGVQKFDESIVKVMITQGGSFNHKISESGKSNWFYRILPFPIPTQKSLRLVVKKAIKSNFPEIKSTGSYHDAMVLKSQAEKEGFDDFLYFTTETGIKETSMANIFFVVRSHGQRILMTPEDNILHGITRSIVLSLAKSSEDLFHCAICLPSSIFSENLLSEAEECFLTSTTLGIKEVEQIRHANGRVYDFKKTEATSKLKERFLKYREEYFQKNTPT